MSAFRVLVADHPATRAGVRMALGEGVEICAEADDARGAIRAAMREQPDMCLVGSEIKGGGLGAVRGICRAAPRSAVVVLAKTADVDDLVDAVRAGAIGYVPGALSEDRLRRIVTAVRADEAVIPRTMTLDLLLELRGGGSLMSAREAQVLGLLRRGHDTAGIAARLGIRPVTVRRHISDLVRKLGVADRRELIDVAKQYVRSAPPRDGVANPADVVG